MYRARPFRNDDTPALLDFVQARGFGVVVLAGNGETAAAHVPLLLHRDGGRLGRLQFHVAKANTLHRHVDAGQRALIIVSGPDAYVSPDWYTAADQVPTWNYVAVHAAGPVRRLDDEALADQLAGLSAAEEQRLLPKPPWTPDKMSPGLFAGMRKAVVGIEMAIETLEGQWKLSQNKAPPDRRGVVAGLERQGGPAHLAIADLMRQALDE